jgi:type II secretory pathway component PulC
MQPQAAAARRLIASLAVLGAPGCTSPALPPTAVVQIAPASSAPARRARPRKVDGRIHEVSSGHYEVESALFESLVEAPPEVAPGVWSEPVEEEGKQVGYRLGGIKPGSVIFRLGLLDDDILEIINGESARSPQAIEAARASARRTGQVSVVLRRNGFQKLMLYRLVY